MDSALPHDGKCGIFSMVSELKKKKNSPIFILYTTYTEWSLVMDFFQVSYDRHCFNRNNLTMDTNNHNNNCILESEKGGRLFNDPLFTLGKFCCYSQHKSMEAKQLAPHNLFTSSYL